MYKKNILNSPRLLEWKKKKRRVIRNKVIIILSLFLALFVGLCFISRIPKLNISYVVVSGNKVVDTSDIEKVANQSLAGHYLWLIPKTNLLLLPKNKVVHKLEEKYKRLKDINLNVGGDRVLEIKVGERVGLFTWCGDALPLGDASIQDTKCYFMDESGYVFDVAPYFSGDVYFKYFGKIEGEVEDPTGFTFLPNTFKEIDTFRVGIKGSGIEPTALLIKENNVAEIYLSSNKLSSDSPKIIFNINADLTKLAENLQASVGGEPLSKELKDKSKSLEYIDLRFGNKVYYKFR